MGRHDFGTTVNHADKTPAQWEAALQSAQARIAELEQAVTMHEHDRMLFDTLLDHLPDHVYFKDSQSRFTRVSRSLAAKHGLSDPAQALGMTDFDFFTQAHAQPAFDLEKRILETGKPIVGLVEQETWPDGHSTWVTTTKLPLHDEAGRVIGTFGVSRDITALKQAQDALRENEAIYHSLVDGLTQNLFRKDLEGRVTFANATYCATMGRSLQDLIGKTDFDLFPADLAAKYVADDKKVIETRKSLEVIEEHQRPTGETLHVQVIKTAVCDSHGRVIGTQGMFWDVTEKILYQQTLERLAAIVESSEDAIIGTTLDGIVLSWNPGAERLYGYNMNEAIGKRIDMVVPREVRDEVLAIEERMRAGERISNLETSRINKEGKRINVSLSVAPIKNVEGQIVGICGIARDISARQQAEHAIDQLAAIVRSSSDAIMGHTLEGTITTWNPAAEKLYGYSVDEMLGKSITLLSPEDRQDELFLLVGRVAREELIHEFQTVHVAKGGKRLEVSLSVSPIIDAELDRVTGISIISHTK